MATNDRRTAVLSAAGLDHGWLQARARLDLRCDLVWTTFRPGGTDVEPAARFGDYRVAPPAEPIPSQLRQTNELTVDVLRDGHGWSFHRLGPARPYEEERFYLNRTKADRLPFDLLARYAAATGLPIGDLDFLAGPVTTIPNPVSAPAWSTIAELRAAYGYPPTGVVTSLTGKRPATGSPAPSPPPPVDLPVTRLTPDGALPVWTVDVPPADRWSTLARLSGTVDGWIPVLLAGAPYGIGEDCAASTRTPRPAPRCATRPASTSRRRWPRPVVAGSIPRPSRARSRWTGPRRPTWPARSAWCRPPTRPTCWPCWTGPDRPTWPRPPS